MRVGDGRAGCNSAGKTCLYNETDENGRPLAGERKQAEIRIGSRHRYHVDWEARNNTAQCTSPKGTEQHRLEDTEDLESYLVP
jgi:hypothetical protein